MRDRDSISRRAAQMLGLWTLACAAACSKPEAQPAATSATHVSPPTAVSSVATAGPSTSAAPTDSAVAIDAAWVASDPQLTRLLGGATPACAIKETFFSDRD